MKIAVLGTGTVGRTIAGKLESLGHDVMMGTRDPKTTLARDKPDGFGRPPLKEWMTAHGSVRLGTYAEATAHGELLVNATHGIGSLEALAAAGKENINDKVLLDISNPLDLSNGFPPTLTISNTDSLGEQIQRAYPKAKVVKSLNTLSAFLMVAPALLPEAHNLFISGNDEGAKNKVKALLYSFGWKEADLIDLGDITTARGTEQWLPLWARLMGALKSERFNLRIVKGSVPQ